MEKVRIFVEGKADKKFIQDVISHFFHSELDNGDIQQTNGYNTVWIHNLTPNFKRALAEGVTPLIILDANGDFEARRQEIANGLANEGLDINFFLFPDNNTNGNLESILLAITNTTHDNILNCFEAYKNCIAGYSLPDSKAKVFAYLDAVYFGANKDKIKEEKRDYRDEEVWIIESPSVDPLKNFLQPYFT